MSGRRWIAILLNSLVLAGGLFGLPAGAGSFPEWAEQAAARVGANAPAVDDSVDARVLFVEWLVEDQTGTRTITERRLIEILQPEGLEYASSALFETAFTKVDRLEGWARRPNGKVIQIGKKEIWVGQDPDEQTIEETKYHLLKFAAAEPGTLVAFESRWVTDVGLPQNRFLIGRKIPVIEAQVIIKIPQGDGWEVSARTAPGDRFPPRFTSSEARWRFGPLAAEPDSGKALEMVLNWAPAGKQPAFTGWASTSRWIAALWADPADPQPLLKSAFTELQAAPGDWIEKATAAARRIRYHAIETGWSGWRPMPPDVTLQRKSGDCKGKAWLMIQLLRQAGIEAFPVVVNTPRGGPVIEELPGLQFNHAIVGILWRGKVVGPSMTVVDVPGLGPVRLVDATLPESIANDTAQLEGAKGLVLHPTATGLFTVEPAPAANQGKSRHSWRVEPDGALAVAIDGEDTGLFQYRLVEENGALSSETELRDRLYQARFEIHPGLTDFQTSARRTAQGASYSIRYRWPEAIGATGGSLKLGALFDLSRLPLAQGVAGAPRRLPWAGVIEEILELNPGGRPLLAPPKPVAFENELGQVALECRQSGAQLLVVRRLQLSGGTVAAGQSPALTALAETLRQVNTITLRLGPLPASRGAAPSRSDSPARR